MNRHVPGGGASSADRDRERDAVGVSAIVINYNSGDVLGDCLQSLLDNGVTDIRVVDNASTDGSFERLSGLFGKAPGVQLLSNPSNRGFGAAVNDHLDRFQGSQLLVINPDCRLAPGSLSVLSSALEGAPGAGLVGPRVEDASGELEAASCRHFPTPRRAFMSASGLSRFSARFAALAGVATPGSTSITCTRPVEATSGACMLMRSDVFRELGGFDEGYRLHCEDLDLMARIRDAGWSVLYVPEARAIHLKGVSSASRPLWVHRQKHRSLVRFFRQHLAAGASLPARLLYPLGVWAHWLLLWPFQWARRT